MATKMQNYRYIKQNKMNIMIVVFLALVLSANSNIKVQADISSFYFDTIPQRNISTQTTKQKLIAGSKIYCCTYRKSKYEIITQGNKITMVLIYKDRKNSIHGVIKNGKIYSDDPTEKIYKQEGKLYLLKGNTFRVKNVENGDYDDYTLCN